VPFPQTNQAGSYTVVVSNSAGSVTSAPPAVLSVNPVAAPGTVVAWGGNGAGQTSIPLAAQSGVTAIAAGGHCGLPCVFGHTVALKNDGSVVSWGILDQTTVPVAAQSGVTAIAAGGWHSVALKNDGTVVEWGDNGYLATPVTLGERVLSGVTAIAAGINHTVALIGGVQLLPSLNARPQRQ
jgi:alpha-tubulin suppressor-like RCC1 family protein